MSEPIAVTAAPAGGEAGTHRARWTPGRVAALAIGGLLVLLAASLLGAGGTAFWADRTQRDGGYVTTGVHRFSTPGYALATERIDLGSAGVGWLYAPGLLGRIRSRVTPENRASALFVGVGPSAEVDRYLGSVKHTVISDFFADKVEAAPGRQARSAPGQQHFWVASTAGRGARTVVWDPVDGSWTVVVMNTDAKPGIDVATDFGARLPAVLWIAVGLLVAGAVLLAGGVLVLLGAIRGRRASPTTTA